jgi:hypothetical protein
MTWHLKLAKIDTSHLLMWINMHARLSKPTSDCTMRMQSQSAFGLIGSKIRIYWSILKIRSCLHPLDQIWMQTHMCCAFKHHFNWTHSGTLDMDSSRSMQHITLCNMKTSCYSWLLWGIGGAMVCNYYYWISASMLMHWQGFRSLGCCHPMGRQQQ